MVHFGAGSTTQDTAHIYSASAVNTGDWVYVTVTRRKADGLVRLYINGVQEAHWYGTTNTLDATVRVAKLCQCDAANIPLDNPTIVVHFDEIQSLMKAPEAGGEPLVVTLSKACDEMVHVQGKHPRTWLKFVIGD